MVDTFNQLGMDTNNKCRTAMELIFEKALEEPFFSGTYAQMCLDVVTKDEEGGSAFRAMLLKRFQILCRSRSVPLPRRPQPGSGLSAETHS